MIRFVFGGFTVEFTFLFAATVTFCLLTDESGVSALAMSACLLHELGHLLAFAAAGSRPRAMVFELTGIRLVPPERAPGFAQNLLIQSGGVLANLACGAAFWASGFSTAAAVHLALACFSLLPLRTLDGGQILSAVLTRYAPVRGARAAAFLDAAATAALCALCGYMLFSGSRSVTMLVFSGGLAASLSGGLLCGLSRRRKERREALCAGKRGRR